VRVVGFAFLLTVVALPARAAPQDPHADFSGVYLGIQTDYGAGGGGDWCVCTAAPFIADATGGDGGIIVGGHAGWGLRLAFLVIEAETRLSYSDISFAEECGLGVRCAAQVQWLGEGLLGAGVVFGNTHIAAGVGYAAGDVRASTNVALLAGHGGTDIHEGRVYTARIEQGMSGGWRYALEYRYYDMSGTNEIAATPVEIEWTSHIGGLRITYELPTRR